MTYKELRERLDLLSRLDVDLNQEVFFRFNDIDYPILFVGCDDDDIILA